MNYKIIILALLLFMPLHTQAFLGNDFSMNMYENIDKGINDLEETIYKKQLKTDRTGNIVDIEDKVNDLLNAEGFGDCFLEGKLTSTDIQNIGDGRIDKLFEVIGNPDEDNDQCKINDRMSLNLFIKNYYERISDIDAEAKRIAEVQSEAISEIARVGIYSDGNDDNSPFDLIVDLQRINNIIFSKEIEYLGVNREDNNEIFECLYDEFANGDEDSTVNAIESSVNSRDETYLRCQDSLASRNYGETFELEGLSEGIAGGQDGGDIIQFDGVQDDGNTLVCHDSSVNTGLSPEALAQLIQSTSIGREIAPTSIFVPPVDPETGEQSQGNVNYPIKEFSATNDNSVWPCTEFFCIKTEFVVKNYNLLTGGKTKSIESLMEVSNSHLKPFANTSLVQGVMPINNFQSSHRDLNLPDLFQAGVQLQFLPPPILNLDKISGDRDRETGKFGEDFVLDNMLSEYYKKVGLNYEKKNDLQLFLKASNDRKNITDSLELSLNNYKSQSSQFASIYGISEVEDFLNNPQIRFHRDVLDKRVNNVDSEELYLQFVEIERFTSAINDYTVAAAAIIGKMREIPITSGN